MTTDASEQRAARQIADIDQRTAALVGEIADNLRQRAEVRARQQGLQAGKPYEGRRRNGGPGPAAAAGG